MTFFFLILHLSMTKLIPLHTFTGQSGCLLFDFYFFLPHFLGGVLLPEQPLFLLFLLGVMSPDFIGGYIMYLSNMTIISWLLKLKCACVGNLFFLIKQNLVIAFEKSNCLSSLVWLLHTSIGNNTLIHTTSF